MKLEQYTEQELDSIESHIQEHFGNYETVFHEIESPDIHVDICIIEPTEIRPHYTLVTMGMGAHKMNIPDELSEYKLARAELLITLPPDWQIHSHDEEWYWPIRWLKKLARFPGSEGAWFGYGHSIAASEPLAENTALSGFMLTMPYFFGQEAATCTLPDGGEVNFYQLLPLHSDELEYKTSHGAEALEDLFPDDFAMVVNPQRPSVLNGEEDDPRYISDEAEYESLKRKLANGDSLEESDLERLAFTLCKWCLDFIDDEDLGQIPKELKLLFICHKALPDSPFVLDMLCNAALYFIYAAARQTEFTTASKCLTSLHELLDDAPESKRLARSCVHGNILLLSEYLHMEDAPKKTVERQYEALQKLAQPYTKADMEIQGMLAWANRLLVSRALKDDELDEAQKGLAGLAAYLEQYPDNALIACEYASACHQAANKGIDGMLNELDRLAKSYSAAYRAYGESDEAQRFPTYFEPDRLCCLLIDAVSDAAVNATENDDLELLLEHVQLIEAHPFLPEDEHRKIVLQSQLYSNLLMLYGNDGEYGAAHDILARLRALAKQSEEDADDYQIVLDALSDALYNLGKDYIDDDCDAHHAAIKAILSELEELAAKSDNPHQHNRYASLLYNLSGDLEFRKKNFQPVWERLFNYVMQHAVFEDVARSVAEEEKNLVGAADDLKTAFAHQKRAEAIAQHPEYCDFASVQEQFAAASYNLLVLAGNAEHLPLAQLMLDTLAQLAAKYPEDLNIILRLAKGAHNMVVDYGNNGDIKNAKAAYNSIFPAATPFLDDPEIANRAVKAGYNLCIDLINSKRSAEVGKIYEPIRGASPNGEAAEYFAKVAEWAEIFSK